MATTTLERAQARQEAWQYVKALKGVAYTYALFMVGAMTESLDWPDRPKGLSQSRAQHIKDDLGDILGYWL